MKVQRELVMQTSRGKCFPGKGMVSAKILRIPGVLGKFQEVVSRAERARERIVGEESSSRALLAICKDSDFYVSEKGSH